MSYRSYRRPRRCGHCHQQGHDRRTCERLTAVIQSQYSRAVQRNDSHSIKYYADKLALRTGIDPRSGKKAQREASTRRCSYCKATHGAYADRALGHNRRTCGHLKADKARKAQRNAEFRRQVLEQIQRDGLGVGALLTSGVYGYFSPEPGPPKFVARNADKEWRWNPDLLMMVSEIHWENINYWSKGAKVFHCRAVANPLSVYQMRLPYITDGSQRILFSQAHGWATPAEATKQDVTGNYIGQWDSSCDAEGGTTCLFSPAHSTTVKPPTGWLAGGGAMLDDRMKGIKA